MAAATGAPPPMPTAGGTYELQGGKLVCIQQTAEPVTAAHPAPPAPALPPAADPAAPSTKD